MRYGNSQALDWSSVYPADPPVRAWAKRLCGLFALAAILCCLTPAFHLMKGGDTDFSSVPSLSQPQLAEMLGRIRSELVAPVTTPEQYFRTIGDLDANRHQLEKLASGTWEEKALLGRYGLADAGMSLSNDALSRYQERFGIETMASAAQRARADGVIRSGLSSLPAKGVDWAAFGRSFLLAWLHSSTFALGYFILRFKLHGLRVFPEPLRLVFCSIFWMPCAFIYPERIDKNKQVQDAMRYIAYAASASLSFAAVAAKAGERRPEGDTSTAVDNVRVLTMEEVPKPPYSFAGFVGLSSEKVTGNGTVVHDGPVAAWDASLTFRNGVNFDFSGTRALSGDRGSDELDYCVSATRSITASLCYYDIQPEGRERGGDMVSPVFQGSRAVGHGWSGFGRAEAFLLTHGSPGKDGYLLSGGFSRSDSFGHGFRFDQTYSAAYGEGPFGQRSGALLRYEGAISAPLGDRLRIQWFKFKALAPILGARDRTATWSASSGLSFAY